LPKSAPATVSFVGAEVTLTFGETLAPPFVERAK